MRGRLIYPFTLVLQQLDTVATAAVDSGTGYDDVFREPKQVPDGSRYGVGARTENELKVRAQVEPEMYNRLEQFASGANRAARVVCIVHFKELEDRGLLDANNRPIIRVNDRLSAVRDCDDAADIMVIPDNPGLYLHEVQDRGFGFGRTRNLLLLDFRERERGVRR